MTGNYMSAPNDRVAWDRDGSVLVMVADNGSATAQSASLRRIVNGESGVGIPSSRSVAILFPVPMDATAAFFAQQKNHNYYTWSVSTSKDSTNGVDGTWDLQIATIDSRRDVSPDYRILGKMIMLQANSMSTGIRAIKFTNIVSDPYIYPITALHIYATPSVSATKDRLAIWHPTSNVKASPDQFDWGEAPRSSSADRTFRIKNLSSSLTAKDISVYIEELTAAPLSVAGMHTLSDNGGSTFLAGLAIPTLAPGSISPVLTLRRVVPANASVSVWSARLAADVTSWE